MRLIWFALAVLLLCVCIAATYEAHTWRTFAKAHDCKVIARSAESIPLIPIKTQYRCSNGMIYMR